MSTDPNVVRIDGPSQSRGDSPGDGDTIVWLGSLGSDASMWDRQVEAFADDARCIRIELPGHGGAPAEPGPYAISGLADRAVAVLDELDVSRAHVVGLSIGGMIAMALGIHHPDRVRSLGLLCTSAYLPPQQGWVDRATTVRSQGAGAVAETVVGRWLTADHATAHPDEASAFVAMISGTEAEGYAACCEAIGAMDLRPQLTGISAPTLVVSARDDPATPPDHGRLIADAIESSVFELIDGAHLASHECAPVINALLARHFERAAR